MAAIKFDRYIKLYLQTVSSFPFPFSFNQTPLPFILSSSTCSHNSAMDNFLESSAIPSSTTPPPPPNQSIESKLISPISISIPTKNCTPDRLKVPKPFKYPERYTSPTDAMMSPVSKRLLSKSRKPAPLLPPTLNLHQKEIQIQESRFGDMGLLQS